MTSRQTATLAALLCLAGTATAQTAGNSGGTAHSPCVSRTTGGDYLEVDCPLPSAAEPVRLRFEADFSGGHDDTVASMKLAIDGEPLACDTGSKTHLMGEDGDVSLQCDFSTAAKSAAAGVLHVELIWSHAQYTRYQFVTR